MRKTEVQILPDGTRVFLRDFTKFGNKKQHVGKIRDFIISPEAEEWFEVADVEYLVQLSEGGEYWVSSMLIEGFMYGV